MTDINPIYTQQWYLTNYLQSKCSYREIARAVEKQILGAKLPPPQSVIDFGCSYGGMIEAMQCILRIPSSAAYGIDNHNDVAWLQYEGGYIKADLNEVKQLSVHADIAICIETAEHLKPESADKLVDLLCRASDYIVFSAATPGQGGTDHLNEQPHEYWAAKFDAHGFKERDVLRQNLSERCLPWYRNNIFVYARETEERSNEGKGGV